MAAQSLSILPLPTSSSSSDRHCRNSCNSSFRPSSITTSMDILNSFIRLKLSIHPSNPPRQTSGRFSSIVATVASTPTAPTPEKATPANSVKVPGSRTSLAAKLLRKCGVTFFKVREDTVKLLRNSDMYIFSPEHPPLTEAAQKAIDWAINEKLISGETREVTTSHLLLGIWAQKESAGHIIMATPGFDDDKAKELE